MLPSSLNQQSVESIEMDESRQSSQPVLPWMRKPIDIDFYEESLLSLLPGLDPRLVEALQNVGFSSLLPVQVAVWQETIGPGALERDLCINSPTGSGKTLAYALPIVQMLSTRTLKRLRALVVLPTRDLALQVKEVFATIAPAVGLSVGLAVGQSSIADEVSQLIKRPKFVMEVPYDLEDLQVEFKNSVDILVATPGRLMDHISTTKGFTLEHLCYLVVDETDRLLREAYHSWLPTVLRITSSKKKRLFPCPRASSLSNLGCLNTLRKSGIERGCRDKTYPRLMKMILSATLTRDPSKLSQLDLHHPLFITSGGVTRRYQLPEQLESFRLICKSKLRPLYLVALLQGLKGGKSIVFTSSVRATHWLSTLLNCFDGLPFKVSEYSSLQRQSVRSKALNDFRAGEIQVLVASDAMTRGMDVEGIENVINYDMPCFIKTFIHRAGRTARAGRPGRCFTLVRRREVKRFKMLLEKASKTSCSDYSLPADSIESLHPVFSSALEKVKGCLELETSRKHDIKLARSGKRKLSSKNSQE